jgi:hypothetical protein
MKTKCFPYFFFSLSHDSFKLPNPTNPVFELVAELRVDLVHHLPQQLLVQRLRRVLEIDNVEVLPLETQQSALRPVLEQA